MNYDIVHADILEWAKSYTGPKAHAALMDPPYHLSDPRDPRRGYAYREEDGITWDAVKRKGFMNTEWDGGDIAFQPATWAALAEHLYPGAFIFAFAGTRGYHRMACAMEDAGLILHPAIGWITGQGFPKATRVDTQLDRAAGVEREVIGYGSSGMGYNGGNGTVYTAPATPLARAWGGHRYGLQALKPSFEFIAVAQVPYRGRPVDCITRTGAGALNIDRGRIWTSEDIIAHRKRWE